tara:strand:+ start:417 stop:1223 length:807 start_codon:yes stop_codon:yes gene_type:complete
MTNKNPKKEDSGDKEYFYQIKGRSEPGPYSGWSWPPVLSGRVVAKNSKEARKKVSDEHNHDFPMKLTDKNRDAALYLLHLREIKSDDKRTIELFEPRNCKECGDVFRVIDKYNNGNMESKDSDFCSESCKKINRHKFAVFDFNSMMEKNDAFIYRIYNQNTGKSYIGKTRQAFTLRWYQHFYHGKGTPFHQAIRESAITDWLFSIVEVVVPPENADYAEYITSRESYWISHFNSIEDGYNTQSVNSKFLDEEISLGDGAVISSEDDIC